MEWGVGCGDKHRGLTMGDPGGIVGASDVLVAIGANAEKEVIQ
jgi:hypothetical protein